MPRDPKPPRHPLHNNRWHGHGDRIPGASTRKIGPFDLDVENDGSFEVHLNDGWDSRGVASSGVDARRSAENKLLTLCDSIAHVIRAERAARGEMQVVGTMPPPKLRLPRRR